VCHPVPQKIFIKGVNGRLWATDVVGLQKQRHFLARNEPIKTSIYLSADGPEKNKNIKIIKNEQLLILRKLQQQLNNKFKLLITIFCRPTASSIEG